MSATLKDQLLAEVPKALERVYEVGNETPLERLVLPGIDAEIFLKREDISPIRSYKWRGAYNCAAVLKERGEAKTVVAASAGNHAQGLALAARVLGLQAKIFMPLTTPMMKQNAVKQHGGEHVEIILTGDTFDHASAEARDYTARHRYTTVHAFDNLYTIAGQATIAEELIASNEGPFDMAFIQIGGGGLAAGIAAWLKKSHPDTKIFGVEGVAQASMKASLAAGEPVTLAEIDTFCDGTAVKRPGDLTFALCREFLEKDILTVTNEEVSAATQQLWDAIRVIPEPSGAMGLAGLIQFARAHPEKIRGKKLLAVICGANMDFSKLAMISSQSAVGAYRRRYLRLHIPEIKGSMLQLFEDHFLDVSIAEFQYGKTSATDGWPIIAFEAPSGHGDNLLKGLSAAGVDYIDVTGNADVRYRVIPFNPALFAYPLFYHIHFPERSGSLRDFMRRISGSANICYFNYAYSGEAIGRALIGFEFDSEQDRADFPQLIEGSTVTGRPLAEDVAHRLLTPGK